MVPNVDGSPIPGTDKRTTDSSPTFPLRTAQTTTAEEDNDTVPSGLGTANRRPPGDARHRITAEVHNGGLHLNGAAFSEDEEESEVEHTKRTLFKADPLTANNGMSPKATQHTVLENGHDVMDHVHSVPKNGRKEAIDNRRSFKKNSYDVKVIDHVVLSDSASDEADETYL
jgi:hypothetical protein